MFTRVGAGVDKKVYFGKWFSVDKAHLGSSQSAIGLGPVHDAWFVIMLYSGSPGIL